MLIIWGKKIVHERLGYVVDFCPICRCVRPFKLENVLIKGHIYYISLGWGEVVDVLRVCQVCKIQMSADQTRYPGISNKLVSFDELVLKTQPKWNEPDENRFEIESRLVETPWLIDPDLRADLIEEPFLYLLNPAETAMTGIRLDWKATIIVLLGLVALPSVILIHDSMRPGNDDPTIIGLCTLIILGIIIWEIYMVKYRYLKKHVYPIIVRALLPLRPESHELKPILDLLAQEKSKLGSHVKVSKIMEMLSIHNQQSTQDESDPFKNNNDFSGR